MTAVFFLNQPVLIIYGAFRYFLKAGKTTHRQSAERPHLKFVKAEQAGFSAYLHGNRRYGVIGEQFPQCSFWEALFPLVDPFKQYTNVTHMLRNTCIDKPGTQDNRE